MKHTPGSVHALAAAFTTLGLAAGEANAAVTINLWQDGLNVRGQASGTLSLTGMIFSHTGNFSNAFIIQPDDPAFIFSGPGDSYSGIVSLPTFGAGGFYANGTSSGDSFAFSGDLLLVPTGFISGSNIFAEGIFLDTTVASLGASPGTYVYALPDDMINLVVIPEPSSALLVSFSTFYLVVRRRKKRENQ